MLLKPKSLHAKNEENPKDHERELKIQKNSLDLILTILNKYDIKEHDFIHIKDFLDEYKESKQDNLYFDDIREIKEIIPNISNSFYDFYLFIESLYQNEWKYQIKLELKKPKLVIGILGTRESKKTKFMTCIFDKLCVKKSISSLENDPSDLSILKNGDYLFMNTNGYHLNYEKIYCDIKHKEYLITSIIMDLSDIFLVFISGINSKEEMKRIEKSIYSNTIKGQNFIIIHDYCGYEYDQSLKIFNQFTDQRVGERITKSNVDIYFESNQNTFFHIYLNETDPYSTNFQNILNFISESIIQHQSKKMNKRNDNFIEDIKNSISKNISMYIFGVRNLKIINYSFIINKKDPFG